MTRSMNARPLILERITIVQKRSRKTARPMIATKRIAFITGPPLRYHSSTLFISEISGGTRVRKDAAFRRPDHRGGAGGMPVAGRAGVGGVRVVVSTGARGMESV